MFSLPISIRLCTLGFFSLIAVSGCESPASSVESEASKGLALSAGSAIRIDIGDAQQTITGFGASSAWTTTGLTLAMADFLFTPDTGIGLSMLRMHITPEGSSAEISTAARAAERGALVWAAPWSPPAAWKTSGTVGQGGSLKPEYYQAWADRLAAFAGSMKASGVPLAALSAQNEPDWVAEWETCTWTPSELTLFIRDYLAPAVMKTSPTTKILAPEAANWDDFESFVDPLLADAGARDAIGVFGVHSYGGVARPFPAIAQAGKEFWETEISYEATDGISATLATASLIHTHLTVARVNAWHYWWINSDSDTSLLRSGVILSQTYGLAHYSKFVRPGFRRVTAQATAPTSGVSVSAFTTPAADRVVVVAINENATAVTQAFDFGDTTVKNLIPWVTTGSAPLVEGAAIPVEHQFAYDLPGSSLVTFVSQQFSGADGGGGAGGAGGAAGASGGGAAGAGNGGEGGETAPGFGGTRSGLGGTRSTASGGTRNVARGGAPSGGASVGNGGAVVSSSGGNVAPAGGQSETGTGGAPALGRVPEQPFLPGCYCTTAFVPARPGSPLAPLLGAALASLHLGKRARRRRAGSTK